MKSTIISFLFLLIITFLTTSCKKFLDVKPEDSFLESQVYTSQENVEKAINGIYIQMVQNTSTYGGSMTMSFMDVLAQYYTIPSSNTTYSNFSSNYDYTQSNFLSITQDIWTQSYGLIRQLNIFENGLKNTSTTIIDSTEKNILLGEAMGLRAFFEFDLLRAFGPVYSTNPNDKSIVYNKSTELRQDTAILTADKVSELLLQDIDSSITYLQNDPIATRGVEKMDLINNTTSQNFLKLRNRRFNLYAASLLKSRILLYIGKKQEAYALAKQLINTISVFFPFTDAGRTTPAIQNPDRIFSSEIIFGLSNARLYLNQDLYFTYSLKDEVILKPNQTNLNNIFEGFENDFRYRIQWDVNGNASSSDKTFYKYYDDAKSQDSSYQYFQPLMRISELYYIVAETSDNLTEAASYLNKIRINRGLAVANITSAQVLQNEITKEYKKEFWGEGQLFFYYKRRYITSIVNGTTPTTTISMNQSKYVFPLPNNETNYK